MQNCRLYSEMFHTLWICGRYYHRTIFQGFWLWHRVKSRQGSVNIFKYLFGSWSETEFNLVTKWRFSCHLSKFSSKSVHLYSFSTKTWNMFFFTKYVPSFILIPPKDYSEGNFFTYSFRRVVPSSGYPTEMSVWQWDQTQLNDQHC